MPNTEYFKFPNEQHEVINRSKERVRNNPYLTDKNPEDYDMYQIGVFGENQKQVATDLHEALKNSGFLEKYALFNIRIEVNQ